MKKHLRYLFAVLFMALGAIAWAVGSLAPASTEETIYVPSAPEVGEKYYITSVLYDGTKYFECFLTDVDGTVKQLDEMTEAGVWEVIAAEDGYVYFKSAAGNYFDRAGVSATPVLCRANATGSTVAECADTYSIWSHYANTSDDRYAGYRGDKADRASGWWGTGHVAPNTYHSSAGCYWSTYVKFYNIKGKPMADILAELKEKAAAAKAEMDIRGVGYPVAYSDEYNALHNAIASVEEATVETYTAELENDFNDAYAAYKNSANIELPQAGKYYTINMPGVGWNYNLVAGDNAIVTGEGEATPFYTIANEDGSFTFVTFTGKFFRVLCTNGWIEDKSTTGIADEYTEQYCKLHIVKQTDANTPFGGVRMWGAAGTNATAQERTIVINKNGGFDGYSNNGVCSADYTTAMIWSEYDAPTPLDITYTANEDGSVTANIPATADVYVYDSEMTKIEATVAPVEGATTVTIPAQAIGTTVNLFISGTAAQVATYQFEEPAPAVSPVEDSYEYLPSITLTFAGEVSIITESETGFVPSPVFENDRNSFFGSLSQGDDKTQVTWTPYEEINKDGDYTFVVPAGCIALASGANPEWTYKYTITGHGGGGGGVEPLDYSGWTVDPAEGAIDDLNYFTITFDKSWMGVATLDDYDLPTLKDSDGNVVATAWNAYGWQWDDDWNVKGITVDFDLAGEGITLPFGNYTLELPIKVTNDWNTYYGATVTYNYSYRPKFVRLVSAMPAYMEKQNVEKAMYADATGAKWNTLDAANNTQIWYLATDKYGNKYLKNYGSANYFNNAKTQSAAVTMATTVTPVQIKDLEDGQVNIYVNGEGFALHTGGHSSGAGVSGNIVGWNGTKNSGSAWYVRDITDEDYNAQEADFLAFAAAADAEIGPQAVKAAMAEALAEAKAAYSVAESEKLIKNASQISSPKTEASEGSIAALIDENINTFWHSSWSNPGTDLSLHHLQYNLGKAVQTMEMHYVPRNGAGADFPTVFEIYASATADGEFTKVQTITGVTKTQGEYQVFNIDLGAEYQYIRVLASETTNNRIYWHAAELWFTVPSTITGEAADEAAKLAAAIAVAEALTDPTDADINELKAATETFVWFIQPIKEAEEALADIKSGDNMLYTYEATEEQIADLEAAIKAWDVEACRSIMWDLGQICIEARNLFTLSTSRGYMFAATKAAASRAAAEEGEGEETVNTIAVSSVNTLGLTCAKTEDAQWAFIEYNGLYYLYNYGYKLFMNSDLTLTEKPVRESGFAIENYEYPFAISCNGNWLNISGGYDKGAVIDDWTTADAGNQFAICKAATFDPTDVVQVVVEEFSPKRGEMTVDPAEGEVTGLENVLVTFEAHWQVSSYAMADLLDEDGNSVAQADVLMVPDSEGGSTNQLNIAFDEEYTTPGKYVLSFGVYFYNPTNYDYLYEEIHLNYTIKAAETPLYTATAKAAHDEEWDSYGYDPLDFGELTVEVYEGGRVVVKGFWGVEGYDLDVTANEQGQIGTINNGTKEGSWSVIETGAADPASIKMMPNGGTTLTLSETGTNVLQFAPNGLSGMYYYRIEWEQNPVGVNGVNAGLNGEQSIFNLQGQKLNRTQKGLNIVNGKKVVLK
ncbi:MAG: discoidin domain-containing protein [Bacteroidaceae bacterium]|nr:discoidin domain-containing protein [Bacteroidaceae bacterium]